MKILIFVIFLPILGYAASSKEPLIRLGEVPQFSLTDYTVVTKPNLPSLDTAFQPLPGRWYKVTLLNTKIGSNYVLEFVDFRIDDIEIFIPVESRNHFKRIHTGDEFAFQTRALEHKNFVFPLPIIYNRPFQIYFKIVSHHPSPFEIKSNVRSYSNFASYGFQEYAFLLFFYGI
ncbi:MAG: hypothetical protein K2Q22_04670, partial [Cytophagales bacterium]|nr:hypothetical protein [Cytophagales bacterium]